MTHVVIDIETLGTTPNAPIIAIGAIQFDPDTGQQGEAFYTNIDLSSALKNRTPDGATLAFWLQQSDAARDAITDPAHTTEMYRALYALREYLLDVAPEPRERKVWGNGPLFDLGILEDAYRQYGITIPWRYNAHRDVRTVVDLAAQIGITRDEFTFDGEPHDALDDAKHQAKYVSAMWRAILGYT